MEKKERDVLRGVEKALNFIKSLENEEIEALVKGKYVLTLEEAQIKIDGRSTINTGRKSGNITKEESCNEGGSPTKKGECKSDKKKKTNSQAAKGSYKSSHKEVINEFDVYIRELSRFRNIDEATKYLLANKLTVTKLKILAKKLSIKVKSKAKKIDIIDTVVDGTVGSFLKLEELRKY